MSQDTTSWCNCPSSSASGWLRTSNLQVRSMGGALVNLSNVVTVDVVGETPAHIERQAVQRQCAWGYPRVPCESLPRIATGKVQRKELVRQYTESVGQANAPRLEQTRSGEPQALRNELAKILGIDEVKGQDTFSDLGGDSLRFMQASMMIQF